MHVLPVTQSKFCQSVPQGQYHLEFSSVNEADQLQAKLIEIW